jgi:hypothetical protein
VCVCVYVCACVCHEERLCVKRVYMRVIKRANVIIVCS